MILAIKSLLSFDKLRSCAFYNEELMRFHGYNHLIDWYYFEMPACAYTDKFVENLGNDPNILEHSVDETGLQPSYFGEVLPSNANFANQWAIRNTGQYGGFPGEDARISYAWSKETGSYDIVVAVVDSGVDVDHECLVGHIYIDPSEAVVIGRDADSNGYINDLIGWNTASNNYKSYNSPSHGTGLASIVTTNGNGMSGVAWKSRIMPVNIGTMDSYDIPRVNISFPCDQGKEKQDTYQSPYYSIPSSRVAAGITYAANKGAHIILVAYSVASTGVIRCCSTYPIPRYMADVRDAIKYAGKCGCIVVTAAGDYLPDGHFPTVRQGVEYYEEQCGNDDTPTRILGDKNIFPGAYTNYFPFMINATAHTNWGYLYYERQITSEGDGWYNGYLKGVAYGTQTCDIAAPGKDVLLAQPNNRYGLAGGSSVAAAYVAGAASLIWSRNPYLRNSEVVEIILRTSRRSNYWTSRVGSGGVLNVNDAIVSAMSG